MAMDISGLQGKGSKIGTGTFSSRTPDASN